jgi:predicted permease
MRSLLHDARYGLRQLRRHPTYALTAILSMALGIGATAAVFSVLYGVLIQPYPYRDANRIVVPLIHQKNSSDIWFFRLSRQDLDNLRRLSVVEDATVFNTTTILETDGNLPVSVNVDQTTGNLLDFLRDPPLLGRNYTAAEAPDGAAPPPVVVISYLFWKSHFNGEPGVLGRTIELEHKKYTVIGITEPRFTWSDAEIYMPFSPDVPADRHFLGLIRLRPGIPLAVAGQQIASLLYNVARAHPEQFPHDAWWIETKTLNDWLLGQFKGTLLLLFASVLLLMLIGCGNVSILMLARGTARQQELAMRRALGASRARIVRQLLTEAVMLSLAGGALGIAFAYAGIRLITTLMPQYAIPHEVVIAINQPVLLFSAAISVLCGIVFGISPALEFSRQRLAQQLRAGVRSVTQRGHRVRSVLVAGQVAITLLLLAMAGAAMRHFLEAYNAHLGFDSHHVLMMGVVVPGESYPTYQTRQNYFNTLLQKIRSTPGVTDATYAGGVPIFPGWMQPAQVSGVHQTADRNTMVDLVSASYFQTLRMSLLKGRFFTDDEVLRAANYAVVNQAFVRAFMDGQDPLSRTVRLPQLTAANSSTELAPSAGQPFEIVGIIGDTRNDGLHHPPQPEIFIPSSILAWRGRMLMIRSQQNPAALLNSISASVRTLNPNQALQRPQLLDDFLAEFAWSHERFISILFLIFSAVAVGLAATGLFSTIAYNVEQRTREIGIRMALGSPRRRVLVAVLRGSLITTAIGAVAGVVLTLLLSNTIQRWTDSSTRDLGVLLLVSAFFLLVAALACIVPARTAISVNPVDALRAE